MFQIQFNFKDRSALGDNFETFEEAEKYAQETAAVSTRLVSIDILIVRPLLVKTINCE